MKNMFKLAAVAVSMALVMSLAACSSGDDDVVDASTPEYLLKAQIGKYVASIEYDQNVSDKEIEDLEKAHEAVMDMLGDCEDCLAAYFKEVKKMDLKTSEDEKYSWRGEVSSADITSNIKELTYLKSYGTEKAYHKVYVYKPAIGTALDEVDEAWRVYYIGDSTYTNDKGEFVYVNKDSILKGELNERQAENMKAYTDAAAALKAALSDDDKKTCEAKIKDADDAIKAFGKLENKGVTKDKIKEVTDAVKSMRDYIETEIYDKIQPKAR